MALERNSGAHAETSMAFYDTPDRLICRYSMACRCWSVRGVLQAQDLSNILSSVDSRKYLTMKNTKTWSRYIITYGSTGRKLTKKGRHQRAMCVIFKIAGLPAFTFCLSNAALGSPSLFIESGMMPFSPVVRNDPCTINLVLCLYCYRSWKTHHLYSRLRYHGPTLQFLEYQNGGSCRRVPRD